jgi:N-formylmaleamate deformylase
MMLTQWFSGDVVANGIKLHYHRTGGHKPSVVLAHGITDNGLCWTRLAQALEQDYDCIMYDARGHGQSDQPGSYGLNDHVADLAGLVKALGLDRPVLAGHSMGASNVAATAATYPGLCRGVILEDPPWRQENPDREAHLTHIDGWRADLMAQKTKTGEEILAQGRAGSPPWAEVEWPAWVESKQQVDPDVLVWAKEAPFTSWREIVSRLTCPILLITADPELGAIVLSEVAAEAMGLNSGIQVAHMGGAGHNIRREKFEQYAQTVVAFLRKVY